MRVLVTGASGYIGGRLADEFHRRGASVRAAVLSECDWLSAYEQSAADLTRDDLGPMCSDVDAVVHLAGPNEVKATEHPDEALVATVVGTRRIAEAAAAAGVQRFCYLSTVHVYGAALTPGALIDESVAPQPRHVYGIARLASEHLAKSQTDAIVVRLTNSIGAPAHPDVDRWSLVANDLSRQVVTTGTLRLKSDGSQWRDFVPLTDVCRILADISYEGIEPGTYNLGSGRSPVTIRQIAEMVQELSADLLGTKPEIVAPQPTEPPPDPFIVSTDKLSALGIGPRHTVRDAVEETLRFSIRWKDKLGR